MAKGKKTSFFSVFGLLLVLYGFYAAGAEEQGGFYLVILVPLGLLCTGIGKAGKVLSGDSVEGAVQEDVAQAAEDDPCGSAREIEEKPRRGADKAL